MADKVDIYMPLYVGDYLKDTGDLNAEEHGAYLLLLMHMWNRCGALPNDPDRLRRLAAVDEPKRWVRIWEAIRRFFTETESGSALIQSRLIRELATAQGRREKARTNGGLGGRPKKANKNPDETGRLFLGSANENLNETQSGSEGKPKPNPDESSSPSKSKSEWDPPLTPPFSETEPNPDVPETGFELQRLFERLWRDDDLTRTFYPPEPFVERRCAELMDKIATTPEPTRTNARRELKGVIAFYLKQPEYREAQWPLSAFVQHYKALLVKSRQGRDPGIDAAIAKSGGRPYIPNREASGGSR